MNAASYVYAYLKTLFSQTNSIIIDATKLWTFNSATYMFATANLKYSDYQMSIC